MSTIRTGSPIARMLFDRAYAYKKACLERGDPNGGRWGAIYDRLIFSKVGQGTLPGDCDAGGISPPFTPFV